MGTEQIELPRYQCHKQVWALKIRDIKIDEEGAEVVPDDARYASFRVGPDWVSRFRHSENDSSDHGYYVVYEDGYKSWSPSRAFENGYSEVV